MGERPPAVTEEDHTNQPNQTEGSLQLSKTFEALARKDEEIIELKDEVEKLRKETMVGLTPTEEVLSLRGSLKDVMLRVSQNIFIRLCYFTYVDEVNHSPCACAEKNIRCKSCKHL
jgi:hypothetical protein